MSGRGPKRALPCRGCCPSARGCSSPSRLLPRFCHQLDFSTSGALCVALNKAAAGSAYKCFKDRLVTKAYLALVSPFRKVLLLDVASEFAKLQLGLCRLSSRCWRRASAGARFANRLSALQVRGHVSQSRMTIRYAIGKNTTEGMTHMMCIDGTEGERLLHPALCCPDHPGCAGGS